MNTKKISVAAISLNQIPLDFDHNRDNILNAILDARQQGVKFLCFPELCITGYGCEDTFLAAETARMAFKVLEEILPHTKGLALTLGLPLWYQNSLYNTVCFISDGKIQGFTAKQNLANDGVHYEPRWFKPWPGGQVVEYVVSKKTYLFGDVIFDWQGIKLGFEICEDAWVSARTGISLARRGVDLILNPSASHFAFAKSILRKKHVLEASSRFGVGYIYANLLGNEAGRIIYDGDTLIAEGDVLLASGPRFSFQDYVLTSASIDIETLRAHRAKNRSKTQSLLQSKHKLQNSRKNNSMLIQTEGFKKTKDLFKQGPHWEQSPNIKEEEFTRAVALGLFDYLRKSKSLGFVLNLSGGADSSACACLVYYMVLLGLQNLGVAQFLEKLAYIPAISTLKSKQKNLKVLSQAILKNILFCLFQGTVNNSKACKKAAEELSKALSVSFAEIKIDSLVESYCQLVSKVIHRDLNWKEDDIALQNIQARVRAPSIWLLANIRKSLLICTSNRSEASTGYTTMDGDSAGGISPIAGIDKVFLIQWLKWLEKKGPMGMGPLPILKKILLLAPSAELRPLNKRQKDEEDLMPFEWLDCFERLFVRDRLSPLAILKQAKQIFPKANPKKLAEAIERFINLWVASQWKRERIAPSFHLDEENVDPKTWCRYPILSGGYKRELEEMWANISMVRKIKA